MIDHETASPAATGSPRTWLPAGFPQWFVVAAISLMLSPWCRAQNASFESPPIDYLQAPVADPVSKLAAQVAAGDIELSYDSHQGYLSAVLAALDIPVSSQTLVFSKTSLQLQRISPRLPRALYFNDEVYVGWCQRGDVLELAATDPQQGAIFYTLKQSADGPPVFQRDRGQCLTCHASNRTQNVPGYLVRSVYADGAGQPVLGLGTFTTEDSSPLSERWGGWYVTGNHGQMRHMGNVIYKESVGELDREAGANLQSLDELVSTAPYLSPHSDLVALMVLEHQTQMHNAITAANFETREALHQSFQMNELLGRQPGHVSESAQRRIAAVTERVVSRLLMCDEFPLQAKVSGTSDFADEFATRGVLDSRGRSLRQFDLSERLFRYPCSYLIYSPAFDALPDQARQRVITRLIEILSGRDDDPKFAHLTASLRREILEILGETKPEIAKFASQPAGVGS